MTREAENQADAFSHAVEGVVENLQRMPQEAQTEQIDIMKAGIAVFPKGDLSSAIDAAALQKMEEAKE